MQINFSDPETIHIILMIGQYALLPIAGWAGRRVLTSVKQSIVSELKAHVDAKLAEHETSEMGKFTELSNRISRLEDVIIGRAGRRAASARRDGHGRFA